MMQNLNRWISIPLALVGLTIVPLSCSGGDTIAPGSQAVPVDSFAPESTAVVAMVQIPTWYHAVGTVVAAESIDVAAQSGGRVLHAHVDVGDAVTPGLLLFELEDRKSSARVAQAQAGLALAEAGAVQASTSEARVNRLFEREAATLAQVESARAASDQADAAFALAKEALNEANAFLDDARVLSPCAGTLVERLVDVGDLAAPGRVLVRVRGGVQIEFSTAIRASMIGSLALGDELDVEIPSLQQTLRGAITEIHPDADAASRSLGIKLALPAHSGLRPGLYGKLRLHAGHAETLAVPAEAVIRIGQLENIMVSTPKGWVRRFVRVGSDIEGGRVEILSGLTEGSTIGW